MATAVSPIPSRKNHRALIAGLPCSATYFATDLAHDLLSRAHGACEVIVLNELGEETLRKIAAVESSVLFLSEIPVSAVIETITGADFPVLIIDEDFAAAATDFMAARGSDVVGTVRTMARAQIGREGLAEIPRSARIPIVMQDAASILAENIAFGLGINSSLLSAMVHDRGLNEALASILESHFPHDLHLVSDEQNRLPAIVERFYKFHARRINRSWQMPIDLLSEATPPYGPAGALTDLLGPARCLTFGPYLCLPAGRWSTTFTFSALNNESINTIGLDVTADDEIKVEQSFDVRQSGKFSMRSEFQVRDPYRPFEFRTYLRRGAIAGQYQPLSLELEYLGA